MRLLDYIDNEVDEQFYITNEKVQKFLETIDIDTIVANYISREDNTHNVMQIGNISRTMGTGIIHKEEEFIIVMELALR